jgi:hypothetical protein
MLPKKIDQKSASEIKHILQKLNINHPRVLIDFDQQTVEEHNQDYSINDILEAAGTLTPERGKELLGEITKSREEW